MSVRRGVQTVHPLEIGIKNQIVFENWSQQRNTD